MSATAAQFAANQANAQSSTGPTSDAGKRAASQNALKHGLACGRVIIPGENPAELHKLKKDLRREHQPQGLTEDLLVEKMALSLWFARRATICQAAAFTQSLAEDSESEPVPASLSVLLRYQTTNERAFYKALQTLKTLQKERPQTAPQPAQPLTKNMTPDEIGFVLNATPEQIWEHIENQHKRDHPGEPLPEFTPEEKAELLDSLR